MDTGRVVRAGALALVGVFFCAMAPPQGETKLPDAFVKAHSEGAQRFVTRRGFLPMVNRMQASRLLARDKNKFLVPTPLGPQRIEGTKSIPIIPMLYRNTPTAPYPPADLQKELFDGPWPTGTMKEFYLENSYGALTVNGTVTPWKKAARDDTWYEGLDYEENGETFHCNGLCDTAHLRELFTEAVNAQPAAFDWGAFDNDGPDGLPNSGDDDGVVDFVAFVHPERGGECGREPNIWSHRASLAWSGAGISTRTNRRGSTQKIVIEDYVVTPALACDGATMIQIGVYAHEFGHAFGIPDLYDTNGSRGGASPGLANWCLMSGGSWGGDGNSPERPVHMSPWAKAYLGWLEIVDASQSGALPLPGYEKNNVVIRVPVAPKRFYLLSNIQREGFDGKLLGSGLAVWDIRQSVIEAGMRMNVVNATASNKGVNLLCADGQAQLDKNPGYRGSAADLYPGPTQNRTLDGQSTPAAGGKIAICRIGDPSPTAQYDVFVGVTKCPAPQPHPSPPLRADAGGTDAVEAPPADAEAVGLLEPATKTVQDLQTDPEPAALVSVTGKLLVENGKISITADGAKELIHGPAAGAELQELKKLKGKSVELLGLVEVDTTSKKTHSLKLLSVREKQ